MNHERKQSPLVTGCVIVMAIGLVLFLGLVCLIVIAYILLGSDLFDIPSWLAQ